MPGPLEHLDANESAVYLSTLLDRPVSAPYVRVLAHRHQWRRVWWRRRVYYRLADIETTGEGMLNAQSLTS